ncbi:MAG: hypothetical protein AAGK32_21815, partial [Actinomycetota bacterium]
MTDDTDASPRIDDVAEARTFTVLAVAACLFAWDIGFDIGAFETVDHRRFWAIWVICTVALIGSQLFRDSLQKAGRRRRWVLVVPSLWLLADFLLTDEDAFIGVVLTVLTVAALPFGLYVLARLLAG